MKHSKCFKVILLIAFAVLFLATFSHAAIPASEREALIALYNATDGDHWNVNHGWKTPPLHTDGFAMPGTENQWGCVTVESDHVTKIQAGGSKAPGNIPSSIKNLTELNTLSMSYCNLTGSITPEIGQLSKLTYLSLQSNNLSGSIPPEFGNLTNLTWLDFYSNKLTGSIPAELGNLSNLTYCCFLGNQLSGSIPPELGNLKNLISLILRSNRLTGSIPAELGNMSSLKNLDLGMNQLTGSIPPSLGNLSDLIAISLDSNQLSGSIPSELGNSTEMQAIVLYNNQLTGSIPASFGNFRNLHQIHLGCNKLTGEIPTGLCVSTNLVNIVLYDNQLTGSIPREIGNLVNLNYLMLNSNKISGSIPPEIGNCTKLIQFEVPNNLISGPIPKELGNCTQLEELNCMQNQLNGRIPSQLGNLTNLIYMNFSYNSLIGPIPSELGNLTKAVTFSFYSNNLSSELPESLKNLSACTYFDISQNCGFTASDSSLRTFLNSKDSNWETDQKNCNLSSLSLSSPNGGESWIAGDSYTITWNTSGTIENVKIEYTTDNGSSWNTIVSSTTNTGSYSWKLPVINSTQCKVRVSEATNLFPADSSNAVFTIYIPTRSLTVQSLPASGVIISVSPQDNNSNSNGTTSFTRTYNINTSVTLTAPLTFNNSTFTKWTIDGVDNTNVSINVTMSADHTIVAFYTPFYSLQVQSNVSGVGITVSPQDNNSSASGSTPFTRVYNKDSVVTLTAPSTHINYNFVKWTVDGVDNTNASINVTMSADHTVVAIYEPQPPAETYTLQVQSNVESGVVITVSPQDNNTNSNGTTSFSRTYNKDTVVSLTAPTTANGYPFIKWTVDGSDNTNASINVTMNQGHTVVAIYELPPLTFTLQVQSNVESGVAITVSPQDNNTNGNGTTPFSRTYNKDTVVTLTAPTTANDYTFTKWTIDGTDNANASITVTMSQGHTAVAIYEKNNSPKKYTLTVESTHSHGCPITVSPTDENGEKDGITTFTRLYQEGSVVSLVAPAQYSGQKFQEWKVDGKTLTNSTSLTLTITENHKAKAYYTIPNNPGLVLRPTQLNFGFRDKSDLPPSEVLRVSINGASLDWTAVSSVPWITVSPNSGNGTKEVTVSLNDSVKTLEPGKYSGVITVAAPGADHSPQDVKVNLVIFAVNSESGLQGEFVTPADGSTVYGAIAVTGWVVDGMGIKNVKIYREGDKPKDLIYVSDAIFIDGARPDVESLFPEYPGSNKSGWGCMVLTNFFPNGGNGTFKLHVIATNAEDKELELGVKTISCDNEHSIKPFGAIDTPTQGGETSGSSYLNWGWVLTPQPNIIPIDGSTISVCVDGQKVGSPVYNLFRSDIADLFPGFNNSNGAVGYFYLDTTMLEDGLHTIQWVVTDNAGNSEGIGSRYFTVNNADSISADVQTLNIDSTAVDTVSLDQMEIEANELEPIRIEPGDSGILTDCSGFMKVGNQYKPLPIGSTFVKQNGTFSWLPGPGFVGDYHLVFTGKNDQGYPVKKDIMIHIKPRY